MLRILLRLYIRNKEDLIMLVTFPDEFVEACLREGIKVFDMDNLYKELSDEEFDKIDEKFGKDRTMKGYRKEVREVIKLVNNKKRLPARLSHLVDNYLGIESKVIENDD